MFNKTSKVKFHDDRLEDISNENAVLRSKLQSKIDALIIMSQDYDKCCMDRDKYKFLVEQTQGNLNINENVMGGKLLHKGSRLYISNGEQMLIETKEKNKKLMFEVETYKQKLEETQEDIKVLRSQLSSNVNFGPNSKVDLLHYEREELVQQLEEAIKKTKQMQLDFQAVLDEKDELIIERDNLKCKLHRLNHHLNVVLSANQASENETGANIAPLLDIDAIVMENRYLQELLQQIQAEKDIAAQTVMKYKELLECKRKKAPVKLGTNLFSDVVMSHKEVKKLLEFGSLQDLPVSSATIADLRSLSLGLLESLNDKSIALLHQRKTNKILAFRITELEKRVQSLIGVNNDMSMFPSKILLDSYNPSQVDSYNPSQVDSYERGTNEDRIDRTEQHVKDFSYAEVGNDAAIDIQLCCNVGTGSAFGSDSSSSAESYSNDDRKDLPPELEELVQRALKDMRIKY